MLAAADCTRVHSGSATAAHLRKSACRGLRCLGRRHCRTARVAVGTACKEKHTVGQCLQELQHCCRRAALALRGAAQGWKQGRQGWHAGCLSLQEPTRVWR